MIKHNYKGPGIYQVTKFLKVKGSSFVWFFSLTLQLVESCKKNMNIFVRWLSNL